MNISASIRKVTLLFVVLFIGLSAGLVYWQVVVADQVKANTYNPRHYAPDNIPVRGRILDRNGKVLAETINGVRHYSDPSLAPLIGYYVNPTIPATGIEGLYNDYLSGQVGFTSLDNMINQTLHRPPVGDDIYLTIDDRIQQVVNTDFDIPITIDRNLTFPTDRGSVVVTDPHSGQLLAMLSRPTFDPNKMVQTLSKGDQSYYNQMNTDPEQPLLMRPFQSAYPPGSTYKTMTLVAGLDSGATTLDQRFDKKHALGPVTIGGERFGPDGNNIEGYTLERQFPVSTEYGFTHSDNIIFAQIGAETGPEKWQAYNESFYVDKQLPTTDAFRWQVRKSSIFGSGVTSGDLTLNLLGENAFGQGRDFMTPFQMSLLDDAIANGGQLMQPMLITKITDQNGATLQTFDQQALGNQQMSSDTAMKVRKAMFSVARCGSGRLAPQLKYSKYNLIGKTGTAQVSNAQDVPAHSWLITQAPYDLTNQGQLPLLTIVGMKENGGEGGNVIGPMTGKMYDDIFDNIMKTPLPTPPDQNYCITSGMSTVQ